tara:strand:- start:47 stop:304 length:258 start_codon:yes stop_codon:yes gene_type:complete
MKKSHGKGEDFAPKDLISSALGTCVITIMGIEAHREGLQLCEINIEVFKTMISKGLREIKSLVLEILISSQLNFQKLTILLKNFL